MKKYNKNNDIIRSILFICDYYNVSIKEIYFNEIDIIISVNNKPDNIKAFKNEIKSIHKNLKIKNYA